MCHTAPAKLRRKGKAQRSAVVQIHRAQLRPIAPIRNWMGCFAWVWLVGLVWLVGWLVGFLVDLIG